MSGRTPEAAGPRLGTAGRDGVTFPPTPWSPSSRRSSSRRSRPTTCPATSARRWITLLCPMLLVLILAAAAPALLPVGRGRRPRGSTRRLGFLRTGARPPRPRQGAWTGSGASRAGAWRCCSPSTSTLFHARPLHARRGLLRLLPRAPVRDVDLHAAHLRHRCLQGRGDGLARQRRPSWCGLYGLARRASRWWLVLGRAGGAASCWWPPRSTRTAAASTSSRSRWPPGPLRASITAADGARGRHLRRRGGGEDVRRLQAHPGATSPARAPRAPSCSTTRCWRSSTRDEVLAVVAHEAGHVHEPKWPGRIASSLVRWRCSSSSTGCCSARRPAAGSATTRFADIRTLPFLYAAALRPASCWRTPSPAPSPASGSARRTVRPAPHRRPRRVPAHAGEGRAGQQDGPRAAPLGRPQGPVAIRPWRERIADGSARLHLKKAAAGGPSPSPAPAHPPAATAGPLPYGPAALPFPARYACGAAAASSAPRPPCVMAFTSARARRPADVSPCGSASTALATSVKPCRSPLRR